MKLPIAKILFVLLGASLAAGALRAEPLSGGDLQALLGRIREKRAATPQVQADFEEQKSIHLLNKPVTSVGKVWFHAPDKFRREVKGNSPSLTVSDGRQLWIYYPKFQSAELYTLGRHSPLENSIAAVTAGLNLERVEEFYNITGARVEKGYQLELTPRQPAMKKFLQRFRISMDESFQVSRTEMLQPNGDSIVTIYTNESRAPLDAAMFQFSPPAGTSISTPLGR